MTKTNPLNIILHRRGMQRKIKESLAIATPNGINENQYISIGDIHQWISIRGEDRKNPVLLFVHGGPGAVQTIFTSILKPWEKYFTIVQWDQRGAGKTLRKNSAPKTGELTLKQLEKDGIAIAEYLKSHLNIDKMLLVATSAGSTVGLAMALHRPDLFFAYVGADQNIGSQSNQRTYELTLQWLRDSGNKKGVQAVESIGPPNPHWTQGQYEQVTRWATKANPSVPNMVSDVIFPAMLTSPSHTFRDIGDIAKGMKVSMQSLYPDLAEFDAYKLGLDFKLPFFIFQGDTDAIAPVDKAKEYFDQVKAPYKEFVIIKNSGHLAAFTHPEEFLKNLVEKVLPQIAEKGRPIN